MAMDMTHYNRSLIDCSPSRFAIWRKLKSEEAKQMAAVLDEIFQKKFGLRTIVR